MRLFKPVWVKALLLAPSGCFSFCFFFSNVFLYKVYALDPSSIILPPAMAKLLLGRPV